jgi:hypothetical protein
MREARRDVGLVIPFLLSLLSLLIGIAASELALKYVPNKAGLLIGGLIGIYVLLGAFHIWKHIRLERNTVSAMQFYLDLETVEKSHKAQLLELDEVQRWSFQWLALSTQMGAIVRLHCQRADTRGGASPDEVRATCKQIVARLVDARDPCLRYRPGDETFNVHIFAWNDTDRLLETYIRAQGSRIPCHNRKWREREGHAGHCFAINKPLILADLQGAEGQGYRINDLPTDKDLYRSIIDLPIPGATDGPWGVVTITSGVPGQFRELDFLPLNLVSDALAIVLSTQVDKAS